MSYYEYGFRHYLAGDFSRILYLLVPEYRNGYDAAARKA